MAGAVGRQEEGHRDCGGVVGDSRDDSRWDGADDLYV